MITPLFGFLDNAQDAITEFLHNCLLVAGGFLVGYILGGLIGWVVGKYIFRQQSPEVFQKIGRPAGGVLLALIVALIVFTGRGKSPGDGGDGKGNTTTDPNAEKKADPKTDPKIDPKLPPIKLPDAKQPDVTIWVTILEGAAIPAPGKFYRVDEEDTAKTLDELKAALNERKAKEKGKVVLVIQFLNKTRPGDPRLLTDVTNWATTTGGLDVILRAN